MVNKYKGQCSKCSQTVKPGEGRAYKSGRYWLVSHLDCEEAEPTHKEQFGRCEDAPCCGCCGGNADDAYMIY